jgi:hypothetical protein
MKSKVPAFQVLAAAPTREASAASSSDDEDKEAVVLRRYSEIWDSVLPNSLESVRYEEHGAALFQERIL